MVGRDGEIGNFAPRPVNPGRKLELGIAMNRLQNMVGKCAREQQWKSECATRIPVQVGHASLSRLSVNILKLDGGKYFTALLFLNLF